jgi:hypothetical protein
MSGYYFDLRERRLLTPGHTGLEVDDADAVERQGAEAATRIGRDPSSREGTPDITVEAGSEPSQRMGRVSASMQFTRVAAPPIAPGGSPPLDASDAGFRATVALLS